MFKSISSKLIALFILITLISFSIAGVILYYFLDRFAFAEKENTLEQNAEKICSVFDIFYQNRSNMFREQSLDFLEVTIEAVSDMTNSYVWIINTKGQIILSYPNIYEDDPEFKHKLIFEDNVYRLPDSKQYSKVILSGKEVVEKGNLYDLFTQKMLTIEMPYTITNDKAQSEVISAVYISTPMPHIYQLQRSVFRFFLNSVFIAILISVLFALVFSRKITKPLKEINNAARIIAGGEFQNTLSISSKDEIGELAASFNNMIEALKNLEDMRRGFIANVSHELRTPMTSIRGFIEGILDGTIPCERQNYYLSIVRDEVNRMNRLVNDLLDLARMEAGEIKLNLIDFNINELMRRSIIKIESLIIEKNINVEAEFEEEELYVYADVDSIQRVILNLMHNAIKFTSEGGKIKLKTSRKRDKVVVCVEDNGPGISKDEINLIWDRFYKSDKSRGKDKTGTGLGLAIVKNIITEHGQDIYVESEQGVGTKFIFTLSRSSEKAV